MKPRIAIIGGGLGGLSAAAWLSRKGCKVTVFEQSSHLGGKMRESRFAGCRFDCGPSLLTMPFVIDEIFTSVRENPRDYFTYEPLMPLCRYEFPDGEVLNAYSDLERFQAEVRRFSEQDATALKHFLEYSKTIYDLTADIFLFNAIFSRKNLLRRDSWKALSQLGKLDLNRTMHQSVSSFFKSPKMRQLFDRYATYSGSSPYLAPATLNVIPHVEYNMGGYSVKGGMYQIADSLVRLNEKLGTTFHLETKVDKILISRGRASGLRVNGVEEPFDAIISNADVVETYTALLGDKQNWRQKLEPSSSGLVFLWAVKGRTNLEHHNIFFSADYEREFSEIVNGTAPSDPTVYICVSSKSGPGHAPEGWENHFVLVNMPWLREGSRTDVDAMKERILARLSDAGLRLDIQAEQVIRPEDFYYNTSSNRGSIYGISSNSRFTTFLRQPNKVRGLGRLYCCGGSAHPGGGVPLVLSSGRIAAEYAAADLGLDC